MEEKPPICPHCRGDEYIPVQDPDGKHLGFKPCVCVEIKRIFAALHRAHIPEHYQEATLDNFKPSKDTVLFNALGAAHRFIDAYHPRQVRGLLFTGTVGSGKTHLAIAILRELIARGFAGRFVDLRELLKDLQNTYNHSIQASEAEILNPVLTTPLLVIDELGAARQTDWTADMVEHIVNTRYNRTLATIITTNYPFAGPLAVDPRANSDGYSRARPSMRGETLGDRVGARVFSRLQEMVTVVEMHAEDYRTRSHKP